jgi:hypothetical protein
MSLNIINKPQLVTGSGRGLVSKILALHFHISTLFTVTQIHEYAWRFYNGHYSLLNNLNALAPILVLLGISISLYIASKRIA